MKKLYLLLGCLLSLDALAYSAAELREDCQAADTTIVQNKPADPQHALRVARCTYYLSGFADGYTVGDYLADKVGVQLNAFCVPRTPAEMVEAVRRLAADRAAGLPGGGTRRIVQQQTWERAAAGVLEALEGAAAPSRARRP